MKFSERWLRTLVDPPLDTAALCNALTMAGLEVEDAVRAAPPFAGVVVGRITRIEPHPSADRLRVCTVDIGGPLPLPIVCGAPNAAVGMKAPCATIGARLPGGLSIKAVSMRGVESQGMLCSAAELGIADDASGLLALPADAEVGADVRVVLALDDTLITLKLTPNRADCLSLVGIAREVAAITRAPLRIPAFGATPVASVGETSRSGRGSGRLSALCLAHDRGDRSARANPAMDEGTAGTQRHPIDLGRRRRHQLRDARAWSAAARVRRSAARRRHRGPLRAPG